MVDDASSVLGLEAPKTLAEFFRTLKVMKDQGTLVVITSNQDLGQLNLGQDNIGHLHSGLVLPFGPLGEATMDGMVRQRLEIEGVDLDKDWIEEIVRNVAQDGRALTGALNAICAHWNLMKGLPTEDEFREIIVGYQRSDPTITSKQIIAAVIREMDDDDVTAETIFGRWKKGNQAWARHIVMHLLSDVLTFSPPEIMKVVTCVKDLSTIYYGLGRAKDRTRENDADRNLVTRIRESLQTYRGDK